MKYCKNCGMLLEDTYETCIRCGTDVSIQENVSLYPPEVMESLETQKTETKKKMTIILLIIGILVVLAVLVALAAIGINNGSLTMPMAQADVEEEYIEEEEVEEIEEVEASEDYDDYPEDEEYDDSEEIEDEDSLSDFDEIGDDAEVIEDEAVEEEPEDAPRKISDSKGHYYNYVSETDKVGNVIFNGVYPEDLNVVDFEVEYDNYSTRYPVSMTFSATNEDNSVRFLYISPKQYWYKASETGRTLGNNIDPSKYMFYYEYDGAQGYVETMLKTSYPKAKITLIEEEEISPEGSAAIKSMSDKVNKALRKEVRDSDYGHIGENTEYAVMDAECSAKAYKYEIKLSNTEILFEKFYVPMISNTIYYANSDMDDRGNLTEWYILAFVVMETGNEDLYDDYSADFDMFIANSIPTNTFFAINQQYSEEILESVNASRDIDELTEDLLKSYGKKAASMSPDEFNSEIINAYAASGKLFGNGSNAFYTGNDTAVAFLDKKNNKLFVSPDAAEYPGDNYTEYSTDEDDMNTDDEEMAEDEDDSSDEDEDSDDEIESEDDEDTGLL